MPEEPFLTGCNEGSPRQNAMRVPVCIPWVLSGMESRRRVWGGGERFVLPGSPSGDRTSQRNCKSPGGEALTSMK